MHNALHRTADGIWIGAGCLRTQAGMISEICWADNGIAMLAVGEHQAVWSGVAADGSFAAEARTLDTGATFGALSPGGDLAATGDSDTLRVWTWDHPDPVLTLSSEEEPEIRWSRHGDTVYNADPSGEGQSYQFTSVAFDPVGPGMVYGRTDDRDARLSGYEDHLPWSGSFQLVRLDRRRDQPETPLADGLALAQSPFASVHPTLRHDGSPVITLGPDRSTPLFNAGRVIPSRSGRISVLTGRSDSDTWDGFVSREHVGDFWDAIAVENALLVGVAGGGTHRIETGTAGMTALAIHPDERSIAVSLTDPSVMVWDVKAQIERWRVPLPSPAVSLAFQDSVLAVVTNGGRTIDFDVRDGRPSSYLTLPGHQPVAASLRSTGDLVVTGYDDGTLRTWERR